MNSSLGKLVSIGRFVKKTSGDFKIDSIGYTVSAMSSRITCEKGTFPFGRRLGRIKVFALTFSTDNLILFALTNDLRRR